MSIEHPNYWLAYLSDGQGEARDDEIVAVAPEILDRRLFCSDAQMLLSAADAYHGCHRHERVVFAAAVTRWLYVEHRRRWDDLDTDFDEALSELDSHAPALLIQASPIARAIVANAALHRELFIVGEGVQNADVHTEPVRAAILGALERDWPPYIARVLTKASSR